MATIEEGMRRLEETADAIAGRLGAKVHHTEWALGGKGYRFIVDLHPDRVRSARTEFSLTELAGYGGEGKEGLDQRLEDAIKISLDKLNIRASRLGGAKRLPGE